MATLPEQQARQTIDAMLAAAGWAVQDDKAFDPSASTGIALREVPLKSGRCDYLIRGKPWVNNQAHVFRATGAVSTANVNHSLAHHPFTAQTSGSTGRRKLSQQGFMCAPHLLLLLAEQTLTVAEVERRLSVVEELEAVVTTNLQRATRLRQSILHRAFEGKL